ncbi:hypothetical protein LSG31_19165 [Fodinisporobacter ferrooxydans]|uniref:DUF366 domain-containing protein n=1 Tax=Fodinisporobacter ferrooxydans TaxID=2901836 RepID=A0ABY4CKJ5_9BACL|nr:hypothetical protein LSG31_19165 [Alicyclobacillaceae bacterium MYW30-H2]
MFDPTIFDNLKIVLEGELYDQERNGMIHLLGRNDWLDLASFRRSFQMQMFYVSLPEIQISIHLSSELKDFATELLKAVADERPGCIMQVILQMDNCVLDEAKLACTHQSFLAQWEYSVHIQYKTITCYPSIVATDHSHSDQLLHPHTGSVIELTFMQKINESHIDEFSALIETIRDIASYVKSHWL